MTQRRTDPKNLSRRDMLEFVPAATAGVAATALLPTIATAASATPSSVALPPAFQRRRVGEATVTAILDGYLEILPEWWINLDEETLEADLAQNFLPPDKPLRISVNAYVVEIGERMIAIDTGAQALFGPTAGRYRHVLAQAGIDPASIDTVLLTHMHPDHVGGLVSDGAATFPSAQIVATAREHAYWTDDGNRAKAPDMAAPWFAAVRELTEVYDERIRLIAMGADAAPGIQTVDLRGHTPGHVGFLLESEGDRLFFWADVVDQAALQLNAPERGLIFDIDPDAAIASRRRAIAIAAEDRVPIAGSHVPFPSFGHVGGRQGAYRFHPAEWTYAL